MLYFYSSTSQTIRPLPLSWNCSFSIVYAWYWGSHWRLYPWHFSFFVFYGTVKSYASSNNLGSYPHLFLHLPLIFNTPNSKFHFTQPHLASSHMFGFPLPLFPIYNLYCLGCWTSLLIIFGLSVSSLGIPSFTLMPNLNF